VDREGRRNVKESRNEVEVAKRALSRGKEGFQDAHIRYPIALRSKRESSG
jgi:hypothetical protein